MSIRSKSTGFTLIELLVVVAIIGTLATIVISSLGESRVRARDALRFANIRSIQSSLEIYYLDNGSYPSSFNIAGGSANLPNNSWANSSYTSWTNLETLMGIDLPEDPVNEQTVSWPGSSNTTYQYTYYSDIPGCGGYGRGYILVYQLESRNPTADENPGVIKCSDGLPLKYSGAGGALNVGFSPAN